MRTQRHRLAPPSPPPARACACFVCDESFAPPHRRCAAGLRNAAKIVEEGVLPGMVKDRYSSFDSDLGKKIEAGGSSLRELEAHALANGEPPILSGKQELYETIFTEYC